MFTGDPLEYPIWNSTFNALVDSKQIVRAVSLTILQIGTSVKLGTEGHYRLYVKNFKGDTPRKSCDC